MLPLRGTSLHISGKDGEHPMGFNHSMKTRFKVSHKAMLLLLALLVAPMTVFAADSALVLKQGDRLAVVGDSITQQKLYSKYIETYLTACAPQLEITAIQLGWGGEAAGGFAGRMDNDLVPWKPNVITLCYGMNDGLYKAYESATGKPFEEAMRKIVTRFKALGATVIVGSPGVVDSFSFKVNATSSTVYNDTLGKLGDINRKIAEDNGMPFADIHGAMLSAMEKAKAANGESFPVAGTDGVHPGPNGQLVMAYEFLRTMGLDGQIAAITVDMNGATTATEGQKILSGGAGKIEIESSRYPFCFFGGEKDSTGTRSILPFVPFQENLNRFTLIVKNLPGKQAEVKWGNASKTFDSEQLAKGINLAAEFVDDNPFTAPFDRVMKAVEEKQKHETDMIKGPVNTVGKLKAGNPADPKLAEAVAASETAWTQWETKKADVRSAFQPVRHTIEIKPVD
jgi:lysophospholipase L1-like esterase